MLFLGMYLLPIFYFLCAKLNPYKNEKNTFINDGSWCIAKLRQRKRR
jgi:hypothetical protein